MKFKDKQLLRQQSEAELIKNLTSLEQELAEARLKMRTGKLKDLKVPSKKRKDIAMIKTWLTNKKKEKK